jgi:hypothetical protein
MALAGRSTRRGSAGVRWLAVGLVLTLFVLLIDASLNSRSQSPGRQLAAGAWYDRALPVITTSTAEGRIVASVWTKGPSQPPAMIASEISQVAAGASQAYQQIVKLRPPAALMGQAGLLEACLLARSQAAASLKAAFTDTLGAAFPGARPAPTTTTTAPAGVGVVPPAVVAVQTALSRIQVGDQAYQLFASTMPSDLRLLVPSSVWLRDPGPYQPQNAQVFLTALHSAAVTTPVHQLSIFSLTTDPPSVSTRGPIQVLPDATAMTVTLVVANVGNQPENNLTVTASISPPTAGTSSVRDFVDLAPGQAHSIVGLGPLNPPLGVPVTLTITVTGLSGSATPLTTTHLVFQMPAPPPPSTTTTTTTRSTTATGG